MNITKTTFVLVFLTTYSANAQDFTLSKTHHNSVESLCNPSEKVLFTCNIRKKILSVCGWQKDYGEKSGVFYRFGRKKNIEIELTDLHQAQVGWSAGGETQIYADGPNHRYIIYDSMVRLKVDSEGHNISSMTQGLLIQKKGKIIQSNTCERNKNSIPPAFNWEEVDLLVPHGSYVEH